MIEAIFDKIQRPDAPIGEESKTVLRGNEAKCREIRAKIENPDDS